ncbi:MAG: hypothetical protein WC735_03910 [Candidatus Paceibacterota bacterium]|jgi:hypothetical protein
MSFNNINHRKLFLIITFSLLSFLAINSQVRSAPSPTPISGWAWSSNIGWISFSSSNDHDANTAGTQQSAFSYGVNKNSSGDLTGYAWSSNIGWIQFGGLAGWPTGGGTTGSNAKIVGNSLVGWAKALSADGNGWDGWISLDGTNYDITLTTAAGAFCPSVDCTGYDFAWGSDVVGWVGFDGVIDSNAPAPSVSLSASDTNITSGQPSTLTWVAINSTSCDATFTSSNSVSGSQSVSPTTETTYSISCIGINGSTVTDSVTIYIDVVPSGWVVVWGACVDGTKTGTATCPEGVTCTPSTPPDPITLPCVKKPIFIEH